MDFEIGTVKSEKAMAMRRYNQIRKVTTFFRLAEVCLVLFFLTWFSSRLPKAARNSGDFFRQLCIFLISPRFVFFFGNAIVITLVAKSGQFSGRSPVGSSSGTDIYDEFLKNSESSHHQKIRAEEEVIYETKNVIFENPNPKTGSDTKKEYRRSASEGPAPAKKRELRRSETDICRRAEESGVRASEAVEMSNEEFRRTIEEFIAKQQKFRREESMAIVWTDQI